MQFVEWSEYSEVACPIFESSICVAAHGELEVLFLSNVKIWGKKNYSNPHKTAANFRNIAKKYYNSTISGLKFEICRKRFNLGNYSRFASKA